MYIYSLGTIVYDNIGGILIEFLYPYKHFKIASSRYC
jgi:hypothetical protein